MMKPELFTCKELAGELKRHVSYVYAMKARGFKMRGDRATLEEALVWLDRHPKPKRGRARSKRGS
jgi:hypothetical protein